MVKVFLKVILWVLPVLVVTSIERLVSECIWLITFWLCTIHSIHGTVDLFVFVLVIRCESWLGWANWRYSRFNLIWHSWIYSCWRSSSWHWLLNRWLRFLIPRVLGFSYLRVRLINSRQGIRSEDFIFVVIIIKLNSTAIVELCVLSRIGVVLCWFRVFEQIWCKACVLYSRSSLGKWVGENVCISFFGRYFHRLAFGSNVF